MVRAQTNSSMLRKSDFFGKRDIFDKNFKLGVARSRTIEELGGSRLIQNTSSNLECRDKLVRAQTNSGDLHRTKKIQKINYGCVGK